MSLGEHSWRLFVAHFAVLYVFLTKKIPIFRYQALRGTTEGEESSAYYNSSIREATLREAIFNQMLYPATFFEEVSLVMLQIVAYLHSCNALNTNNSSYSHDVLCIQIPRSSTSTFL